MLLLSQILIIAALVATAEAAARKGLRASADDPTRSQMNATQGAVLGLLGLLLAFTASMAESRFSARRALILQESNDIGTAYLRASVFAEPQAGKVRALLRRYVDARIAFYEAGVNDEEEARATHDAETLHVALWQEASTLLAATEQRPVATFFASAINSVIDSEGSRKAALDEQIPRSLMVLVVIVALVAMLLTGYAWGLTKQRSRLGVTVLPVLIGIAIGVILDLDAPRTGFIRSGQAPMHRLRASVTEQ